MANEEKKDIQELEKENITEENNDTSASVGSDDRDEISVKDVEEYFNEGFDEIDDEEFFDEEVDIEKIKKEEMNKELDEVEDEVNGLDDENIKIKGDINNENDSSVSSSDIFEPITLSFRGNSVNVNSLDELKVLAEKGLEYTYFKDEYEMLKPVIDQVKAFNIEPDELVALGDAKQGKVEALYYLADRYNISLGSDIDDDLDIVEEQNKKKVKNDYQPNVVTKSPIEEYFDTIMTANPRLGSEVVNVFETLPAQFKQELWTLDNFKMFVDDLEKGDFNKFYNRSILLKAQNPTHTWLSAYLEAKTIPVEEKKENKEPPKAIQNNNRSLRIEEEKKEKPITFEELIKREPSIEEIERELFGDFL